MNRITKQQAAQIAGIHEKTLERYIKDDLNGLLSRTGYEKNKLNGKVTFDEIPFRAFFAEMTGNEDIRTGGDEAGAIDAEVTALTVQTQAPAIQIAPAASNAKRGLDPVNALLLPHKSFLTIDEAAALSGLPKWFLKENRAKIAGRNYIAAAKLPELGKKFAKVGEVRK